ncbi:MAG: Rrf2 family transcriptional regulator [Clostridia bacterium]|nr:Rrf2 family transcriptional regulator [Clostridia bacterium]NLS85014.1 Rrf2 family transcriptional regulator [Oscillospiraceae bacterium]
MTAEFIVAVHSLVFLNHKKCSLSSEMIAENVCTNPARVRKILLKLKKADLISSKGGTDGGYFFEKDPKAVTLRDVLAAVELDVVKIKWRSGDTDMDCEVASGMAGVMDGIFNTLDASCKAQLASITIDDIDKQLFKENKNEL